MKSFLSDILWSTKCLRTREILKAAFAGRKTRPRQRLFLRWKFSHMATSRFVCGEISRLIKLLRAVSRNAQPRETSEEDTEETRVALIWMPPLFSHARCSTKLYPLPPLSLGFFISHPFSLSDSHFAFLLEVFALSTQWTKGDKEKRRKRGDVARGEQEKSLAMKINREKHQR